MGKKIFLTLALVLLVGIGIYYGRQKMQLKTARDQVNALEKVADPVEFTKSFNPEGKNPVQLEIGGLEGRTVHSPYYPYQELQTTTLTLSIGNISFKNGKEINLTTEGRAYDVDPYWNIFWVEIGKSAEYTHFYGPYKLAQ
jgi:hypothetical protein